jgi:hypothetical protein
VLTLRVNWCLLVVTAAQRNEGNGMIDFEVYGQRVSYADMIRDNDEDFAAWAATAQPGDMYNEACTAVQS